MTFDLYVPLCLDTGYGCWPYELATCREEALRLLSGGEWEDVIAVYRFQDDVRPEDVTEDFQTALLADFHRHAGPGDAPHPFIAEEVNSPRYVAQSEKERVA